MNPVSFTVPIRTVSEANSRSHWRAKAKRVKSQRQAVTWAARAAGLKECGCRNACGQWLVAMEAWRQEPAPKLWVTITRVAPNALDVGDNLAVSNKAVRDQIAEHLGIDDRSCDVAWNYSQRRGGVREYAVEISIVEAPTGEVKP